MAAALALAPACGEASARLGGSGGKAENQPTAAVLDFDALHTNPEDAMVIAQFVRSAVVKSGLFMVVDKNNMDKVLAEQAFQRAGCTDTECAVKVGRILNVRYIVIGKYLMFEGNRVLFAQVLDVENGHILSSESETIRGTVSVEETAENLVRRLLTPMDDHGSLKQVRENAAAPSVQPQQPAAPAVPVDLPREESTWKWLVGALLLAGAFVAVVAGNR